MAVFLKPTTRASGASRQSPLGKRESRSTPLLRRTPLPARTQLKWFRVRAGCGLFQSVIARLVQGKSPDLISSTSSIENLGNASADGRILIGGPAPGGSGDAVFQAGAADEMRDAETASSTFFCDCYFDGCLQGCNDSCLGLTRVCIYNLSTGKNGIALLGLKH